MSTPTNPPKKKKAPLSGLKVLIVTLSLSGIIALWNLFASRAQINTSNVPPPPPAPNSWVLHPIPTLATLKKTAVQMVQQPALPGDIREVGQPTPVFIPNQQKPPIQEIVIISPNNNENGGGGGPVTNTGSSK